MLDHYNNHFRVENVNATVLMFNLYVYIHASTYTVVNDISLFRPFPHPTPPLATEKICLLTFTLYYWKRGRIVCVEKKKNRLSYIPACDHTEQHTFDRDEETFAGSSQASDIHTVAASAAVGPGVVLSGIANHEVRDGVCVIAYGERACLNCSTARVLDYVR